MFVLAMVLTRYVYQGTSPRQRGKCLKIAWRGKREPCNQHYLSEAFCRLTPAYTAFWSRRLKLEREVNDHLIPITFPFYFRGASPIHFIIILPRSLLPLPVSTRL